MAKVKGPLLSLEAHGHIKQRLTYSQRKSGNVVRIQMPNKDSKSIVQLAQREKYITCVADWKLLTTEQKEYLQKVGKIHHLTGFNYFLSNCLVAPLLPSGFLLLQDLSFLLLENGGKIEL